MALYLYIFIIRPETPQPIAVSSCAVGSFPLQLSQVMIGSIFLLSPGLFFLTEQLKKKNRIFYYFETKGPQLRLLQKIRDTFATVSSSKCVANFS